MPSRRDWTAAPMLERKLIVCPSCEHGKYDRHRTDDNGDGSITRYCTCRACGQDFKVFLETPEPGELVLWPARIQP